MRTLAEICVFLCLAVGLHLGLLMARPADSGAEAAGDGGEELVSLIAADAVLEELVAEWDRPPETAAPEVETFAPAPPEMIQPEMPQVAAMQPVATPVSQPPAFAPSVPDLAPDMAVTLSPPPPAPVAKAAPPEATRPLKRPERPVAKKEPPKKTAKKPAKTAPKKPSAPSKAQKAAGAGATSNAGVAKTAQNASRDKARAKSELAAWGSAIRSRIERRKRYPSGARGASGSVRIQISVSRSGALLGASIVKSSGNGEIDAAALRAVRAAKKFPAAPKSVTKQSHVFGLDMRFSR
ncbi:energy transducer TonB family protein [Actibacterium lipolyticum]|uniref:Gram-negative bacterial tonB protein n=1 Tax=Actibacterium lipolyticum TaxID=1524263 RepID=A0A238KFA1_9RHOB|nr:TonB family protein [Actibacterium lipolyticum]SMX41533.1 Gram-negative bacterial tonB protein [Actibacterium lipolyticum]